MGYKSRTLFSLIESINHELYLPHIQRPFVWDEEQMERLFDSLMRNYPIQTFLFWRTKDEILVRKFMSKIEPDADLHDYYDSARSALGVEKVFVLDGQQRLQTLFSLFYGSLANPNGHIDRLAYFDVTNGKLREGSPLLYPVVFSDVPLALPYIRLRDFLGVWHQENSFKIAYTLNGELDKLLAEDEQEKADRQQRVHSNVAQIVSLLREDKYFWVEELDGVASKYPYRTVLDIFVRVNSGGTKLTAADLMFAAMKEGWDRIEERIEQVVDLLNDSRLEFDKTFVLKAIVTTMGRGAELNPEKFTSDGGRQLIDEVEDKWSNIEEAFQKLRDFVVTELKLYGPKVIRTYNSFIPLFDYLYHNPTPAQHDRVLMRGYHYKAQLFNWYAARTDNLINSMHTTVSRPSSDGFPIARIKDYFRDSIKVGVELTPEALDMRLRYIILNMIYAEIWGTSAFDVRYKGNEPHIDHIYPQSALRKLGLTTAEINHLGNYRFVGAIDNIRKRAELPADYFLRLKMQGIPLEPHLLLKEYADNPTLLVGDAETYRLFRDCRYEQIYHRAKRIIDPELFSVASAG